MDNVRVQYLSANDHVHQHVDFILYDISLDLFQSKYFCVCDIDHVRGKMNVNKVWIGFRLPL